MAAFNLKLKKKKVIKKIYKSFNFKKFELIHFFFYKKLNVKKKK